MWLDILPICNYFDYTMAGNSRLAIAIHAAGMLAFGEQMPVTSETIAHSVNTNAVVVRRIMGCLTKHGLVTSKMGVGGGACLSRSPAEITLADIYLALDEEALFQVPPLDDVHECAVSKIARPVIRDILQTAENHLLENLRATTLADMIERVRWQFAALGVCRENENE